MKKDDPGVSDLKIDEDIITDDKGKAEILNDHFISVFTEEDLSTVPDMGVNPKPCVGALKITVEGVVKQLKSLNPDKASGPDSMTSWFLKENGTIIAPMLTHIFQESVDTGTIPDQWKEANICPTFKKGKQSDPTNYRPVSLTCVACKVLEHIIHSFVMKHLEKYNVLTDTQHGFRAKRSTGDAITIKNP